MTTELKILCCLRKGGERISTGSPHGAKDLNTHCGVRDVQQNKSAESEHTTAHASTTCSADCGEDKCTVDKIDECNKTTSMT